MRRTALGVGAAATLGGGASTTAVAANYDWTTLGKYAAISLVGGPAAVGVIAYGALIDGPDDEVVADSLDWQAHVNEFTRAREDELTLENTRASLRRDVQLVGNKAREEAIFAIYEQAVDSGTESDATAAAETAINEAYAVVEKSILDSWTLRFLRAEKVHNLLDSGGTWGRDMNEAQMWSSRVDSRTDTSHSALDINTSEYNSRTHNLLDGRSIEYFGHTYEASATPAYGVALDPMPSAYESVETHVDNPDTDLGDQMVLTKPNPNNYDSVSEPLDVSYDFATIADARGWYQILTDLYAEHSNSMDEVSQMVNSYYQPAADGELDLTDLQGPKYLTDTAETATDFQEAAMALRAMGFALAEQKSVVTFKSDGDTYTLDGRLARTVDSPNDLPVGSELNPKDITGSVYGAFNITNDNGDRIGRTFEITEPFTIEEAEGESAVSFARRNLAKSDGSLTAEEIEQIFKENTEAADDAREVVYDTATTTTSGGGGGNLGSDQNWGLIAVGAGAVALGWGYITGDDQ